LVAVRARLRRLERKVIGDASIGDAIVIPQLDRPPARFPRSAAADAYLVAFDHACGRDVPDHPLCAAARNSSDPWWRGSVYAAKPDPREIPDLSE
jgi:hypothetical protein